MINSLTVLDVEPNDNIKKLKQKIMIKESLISSDIDKIYFAGNLPNDKKLSQCGIKNRSTIHIEKDIKIMDNNNNHNSSTFVYNNYNSFETNGSKILQMTDLSKNKNNNDPLIDKSDHFDGPQQSECCVVL